MFAAVLIGALGVVAIVIGIQGFTAKGLPLTEKKRLVGTPAKIVGTCAVVFGCALLLAGIIFVVIVGTRHG